MTFETTWTMRKAYQDGAEFYDSETGRIVASYPNLVSHDYDMAGAKVARAVFLTEFPTYRLED